MHYFRNIRQGHCPQTPSGSVYLPCLGQKPQTPNCPPLKKILHMPMSLYSVFCCKTFVLLIQKLKYVKQTNRIVSEPSYVV